ncbi:MAG: hypothetical protein E6J24_07425 [Chloroflexi bacterium]|nr:MAG: hypothetical protein E6J24_07425 [Chloroflexota bacterium]
MRRSILALTLTAILSLALSGVAVAGQATQTLEITGGATFSSILGGNSNGTVVMSGDLLSGELRDLRGTINFALRDESITVSPTASFTMVSDQLPVQWQQFRCDPTFCGWTFGTAYYARDHGAGPVDLRLGSLKGSGNLVVDRIGDCVSDCPPPGSFYWLPSSGASLNGGVTSSKDAGTLQIYGSVVIR